MKEGCKINKLSSLTEADEYAKQCIIALADNIEDYTLPKKRCALFLSICPSDTKVPRFKVITKSKDFFTLIGCKGKELFLNYDKKSQVMVCVNIRIDDVLSTNVKTIIKRSNTAICQNDTRVTVRDETPSKSKKRCHFCGKPECCQKCLHCQKVYYCSPEHETLDWELIHQKECSK